MVDTKFKKGQKSWNTGLKMSQATRLKQSIVAKATNRIPPSRKGITLPESVRLKMLGRTPWNKGKAGSQLAWNKGITGVIKHTKETKEKISLAHRGEKASGWRGGVTSLYHSIRGSHKYREWRDFVFKRDNYTCQICCKLGNGDLEADHINPYSMIIHKNKIKTLADADRCYELWDLNNGRTLCKACHRLTPTWGHKTRVELIKNKYYATSS